LEGKIQNYTTSPCSSNSLHIQRDRNPTEGPVEDLANFEASFFGKISLSIAKLIQVNNLCTTVDGCSVGQHPLVTRILEAGVIVKAQHLSKQSTVSKPLADFFYPRFPEDQTVFLVVTSATM